MAFFRMKVLAAAMAAAALLITSCTTVNKLGMYRFQGSTLAADMPLPPEPKLDINYDVTLDSKNPVYSALSVVSNLSKASQAEKVTVLMKGALADVNVPDIVLRESSAACASALGADQAGQGAPSDFLLGLEIRDWGIRADSPGSVVSLHIRLTASLVHQRDRDLAWRREISVDQPANPSMFGLGQIAGNIVTAEVLSRMTEQDLARGFRELALEASRSVARRLDRDVFDARALK